MSKHAARQTVTTRVAAAEEAIRGVRAEVAEIRSDVAAIKAGQAEILALLTAGQAAKPSKPKGQTSKPKGKSKAVKAQESEQFVTWLRETAEQRSARKAANAEVSRWLQSKGLPLHRAVWDAAVAGERRVTVLRKIAIEAAAAKSA